MASLRVRAGHRAAFVIAMIALLGHVSARGQEAAEAERVVAIRVEGTQRIDPETVLSYVPVKPGDVATAERLDQSLKALFATELFADATLQRQGGTLIVRIAENPIINRIAFEGNRRIADDILSSEVQLRPRLVYTRTKVQAEVKRILDLYRRSGRFAAKVEPKIVRLPQNRVDLIFEIDEGRVTGVRSINFLGNQRFSDSRLREVIQTKESRWWRILSTDDVYDPDRLAFDQELLRRFYLEQGYADFRVVSSSAELTPDRSGFHITFTLDEGARYRFGLVDVSGTVPGLDPAALADRLVTRPGAWFDAGEIDSTVSALASAAGDQGHVFIQVTPRMERDPAERLVHLTYEVAEGPRLFADKIEITGNERTLDKVIRREMKLAEGDALDMSKLQESLRRIRNLGFFEKVEIRITLPDGQTRTVR